MEDNTMVRGRITICMGMGYILGKMVENMKVIMKWIKSMDMVFILGQMEEDMKVIG